jgi:preprotein translocase subunit SecF
MIKFSKYIWLYFILSGLVIIPGLVALVRFGLKPSIDFAGGTLVELKFTKPVVQSYLEKLIKTENITLASIQTTSQNTYLMRTKGEDAPKFTKLLDTMKKASVSADIVRSESVGPVVGQELLSKAIMAAIFALTVILCYVAYAFKNFRFGFAAILALIHDMLVILGSFALFGAFLGVEVDTLFVTAMLTTMAFSMHDTIVVFDRIREYKKRGSNLPFDQLCDLALTETMGRSLTNSMTIILMLIALVLMGGSTIRWFTIALLIGTISGTYSSDFIATPILILWNRWDQRQKKQK